LGVEVSKGGVEEERLFVAPPLRRLLPAALLCALLLSAALADRASGFVVGGKRWPGRTITYHPGKAPSGMVADAAAAWNESGARINLREIRSRSRADVIFETSNDGGCHGFAQLGWESFIRQATVIIDRACRSNNGGIEATAHEFGHILGLNHETGKCAVMGPATYSPSCRPRRIHLWFCSVLTADDVRGAVRLYGGRPNLKRKGLCQIWSRPAKPASPSVELRTTVIGEGFEEFLARELVVGVRAPQRVRRLLNAPVIFFGGVTQSVHIEYDLSACPAKPGDGLAEEEWIPPKGKRTAELTLEAPSQPGRYCLVAWSTDSLDRRSARTKPVWFTVDPLPPPNEPDPDLGFGPE
jgi:hypothetical protein